MNSLFPEEILKFSSEDHFSRNSVRGRPVYISLVLFILCALISLPFIHIDITYSSRGILRTHDEASRIVAQREGIMHRNYMELNKFVNAGDTLFILDHRSISDEIFDTEKAITLMTIYVKDLVTILEGSGIPKSERYKQVLLEYSHECSRAEGEYAFAQEEYRSMKPLYEEGFIARLEFESIRKRYLVTEALLKAKKKQYQSAWQSELAQYQMEALQLNTRRSQLTKALESHYTTAPVSGYIVDYNEIQSGSYISPGSQIARIVPDQELIASCIIGPDKISRIRPGQSVKLNIDAYPGSTYGRIEGIVASIPEDATLFSGSPGFPITCEISQGFKNKAGKNASLKSGMTFTALFILSRKSLIQLIIEKGEQLLYPPTTQLKNGTTE